MNNFSVGSLVKARGREWVVLPESEGEGRVYLAGKKQKFDFSLRRPV